MSEDEDDPVVDEIPVFLSHALAEQLYVFQYPVIPANLSSGTHNVIKSRIKPENQEVALELGLNTDSPNYDQTHGEQIASTIDKDKARDTRMFQNKIMDKIHFDSTRVLTNADSLGVGVMLGSELHLCPIKAVLSLSPTFKHLEQPKPEDGEEASKTDIVPPPLPLVGRKSNYNSYSNLSRRIAQEPWYNTQYYNVDSPKAQMERLRLRCEMNCEIMLSQSGYLNKLAPGEKTDDDVANQPPPLPDNIVSLSGLRQLALDERVKVALKEMTVAPLSTILWVVGTSDAEKVLHALQQVAIIVQGNWLLRSDLLYPKDTYSTHNGVPHDSMARARDYILYQLNEGKVLERKNLASVVKIPAEELREVMSQVALLKNNKQWHFRLPPDTEFLSKYGHIVEQQKLLWEAKYKQLLETFGCTSPKENSRRRKSSQGSSDGSQPKNRASVKSALS